MAVIPAPALELLQFAAQAAVVVQMTILCAAVEVEVEVEVALIQVNAHLQEAVVCHSRVLFVQEVGEIAVQRE